MEVGGGLRGQGRQLAKPDLGKGEHVQFLLKTHSVTIQVHIWRNGHRNQYFTWNKGRSRTPSTPTRQA